MERTGADWSDVFVYFKHEEQGKGAEFAKILNRSLESRRQAPGSVGLHRALGARSEP